MPLKLQWFHQYKPIGAELLIQLNSGDLYVLSEKAVGSDWSDPSVPTLQHAAGGDGCKLAKTKQKKDHRGSYEQRGLPA